MLAQIAANIGLIALGVAGLYFGAEFLVRGGANLASKLGLSSLIIGLTLVAYGTSAPELVVSLDSALSGQMDISVGNVVGSNICNIALILGLSSVICPLPVNGGLLRRDVPVMLIVSVLFSAVYICFRGIPRWCGAVFCIGIVIYTVMGIRASMGGTAEKDGEEKPSKQMGVLASILFAFAGLGILVAGSKAFVHGSVEIAKLLKVSEAVIGLTLVAVGTSLPELATSVVAAIRKECDIAIGNIVGSNIFNILFIMGSVGVISPFSGGESGISAVDLAMMIGTAFMLLPMMMTSKRISRGEGALLLSVYIAYTAWLIYKA